MSRLFDGLGSVITATFGDTVTIQRLGTPDFTVQAMFRREPVEAIDGDGRAVLLVSPSLKLTRAEADKLATGDTVRAPDGGADLQIVNAQVHSSSPARDALVMVELADADC